MLSKNKGEPLYLKGEWPLDEIVFCTLFPLQIDDFGLCLIFQIFTGF